MFRKKRRSELNKEKDQPALTGAGAKRAGEMSESEIDENLEGSFPASDPPAWTLGSNHRARAEEESEDSEQEND